MSSQDESVPAESGANGIKPELAVGSQLANNVEQTQINRDMYASKERDALIAVTFKPHCHELAKQREHITLPEASEVESAVAQFLEEAIDAVEQFTEAQDEPASGGDNVIASGYEKAAGMEKTDCIPPKVADELDRMHGREVAAISPSLAVALPIVGGAIAGVVAALSGRTTSK